jgi:hypothetical protein
VRILGEFTPLNLVFEAFSGSLVLQIVAFDFEKK